MDHKIDIEDHLSAVQCSLEENTRDGKPVYAAILTRNYDTTIDDLWDAITNKDRIERWFLPVEGNLELGGSYQLKGNAGGKVTECEPPKYFEITWEMGGNVSWVEVYLSENGSGLTKFKMIHTAPPSEYWEKYGPGAVGIGWELGLLGLSLHIADPDTEMPDENTWSVTPEGKQFIRRSSEKWARAAIDAGQDAEKAISASKETTAFYTGESVDTS